MTAEIISPSISTKVWEQVEIKLVTSGSEVRLITNCATGPGLNFRTIQHMVLEDMLFEKCPDGQHDHHL